jgi:hypothetical protein
LAGRGSELNPSLSPESLKAGLFIMLYRDYHFLSKFFQDLDTLIEIDHTLSPGDIST